MAFLNTLFNSSGRVFDRLSFESFRVCLLSFFEVGYLLR